MRAAEHLLQEDVGFSQALEQCGRVGAQRNGASRDLDFSIFRGFPIMGEGRRLEFRAEAFNLFNTVIWAAPNGDVSNSGGFGKITDTANSARVLQFGLRFMF